MSCSKVESCIYGNNINYVCERCYRYYEDRFSRPCSLNDLYKEGEKIKTILIDVNEFERKLKEFEYQNRRDDFYKQFYSYILNCEHFKEEIRRFDA